MDQNLKLK